MIPCYLLLEDGRRFEGVGLGAEGVALGEVVFNTAMTGYQEILTDPSYSGQLVTMTYPLIGNYGTNDEDEESTGPQVSGFIVREAATVPSSWRSRSPLESYLIRHNVVGLAEVDTRALTRHLRSQGAMRGAIANAEVDQESLMARIQDHPKMEGLELASTVSTDEAYVVPANGDPRFHVVAFDFGVKSNSPRMLAARGCSVTVVPAQATTDEVLALEPDGLFVSNGPGDPAAVERAADTIRAVAGRDIPVLGICLGHQLISRAYGAETFKLPFGHHGANHPVRNHDKDTVEITSQNHGFAVRGDTEGSVPGAPDLRVTHTNLYDQTVAGVAHTELPIVSVQYHPESAPGPHDSNYLFDDFVALMESRKG
ncbi:MAG: glutamine-hydrolyzing carbamoyl-phosphate synthase small subunit [Longimicrobiales bacterium]